jgi:hypothetical protein
VTATYSELGLSYDAINWSYDGAELNTFADPVDISYVTCVYVPTAAFRVSYRQLTPTAKYRPALSVVTNGQLSIQKRATYKATYVLTRPVDVSYVTCTYKPSLSVLGTYKQFAKTLTYKPTLSVIPGAKLQTLSRTVTNKPSFSIAAQH